MERLSVARAVGVSKRGDSLESTRGGATLLKGGQPDAGKTQGGEA